MPLVTDESGGEVLYGLFGGGRGCTRFMHSRGGVGRGEHACGLEASYCGAVLTANRLMHSSGMWLFSHAGGVFWLVIERMLPTSCVEAGNATYLESGACGTMMPACSF